MVGLRVVDYVKDLATVTRESSGTLGRDPVVVYLDYCPFVEFPETNPRFSWNTSVCKTS